MGYILLPASKYKEFYLQTTRQNASTNIEDIIWYLFVRISYIKQKIRGTKISS